MGTTSQMSIPYPESSDYVADGATAMENMAEQIDSKTGLVLLNEITITGNPGAQDVGGFTTDFRDYRLVLSNMSGTAGLIRMRFGTNAASYYGTYRFIVYTGSESTYLRNNGSDMPVLNVSSNIENSCSMDLHNMRLNERSQCHGTAVGGDSNGFFGYFHTNATAWSSVRLFMVGGTFSGGTIKLYGYNEG